MDDEIQKTVNEIVHKQAAIVARETESLVVQFMEKNPGVRIEDIGIVQEHSRDGKITIRVADIRER